jgi:hypothetical protein
MWILRKAHLAAGAVLFMSACGTGPADVTEMLPVTWDQPIPEGLDVTSEDLGSLGLPFDPVTRDVPGALVRAQMTAPGEGAATLGLLYRLVGTSSPDPRVTIYEKLNSLTMPELEQASRVGEQRELVTLGSTTGLLIQSKDVGRLIFFVGGIQFDIAGPALSVKDAVRVGEVLEAEVSRR